MLRWFALLFVICLAALVAALQYLPGWGFLLVLVGVAGAIRLALHLATSRLTLSLFSVPFRMKGAVLRKAKADVHSIQAIAPPAGIEPGSSRAYYAIDVTIKPRFPIGPFKFWEPGELMLTPYSHQVASLDDLGPESSEVANVEVFENGRFGPNEGCKYFGKQRLRILVGLPVDAPRRLRFRYYLEAFGDLRLPEPLGAAGNVGSA